MPVLPRRFLPIAFVAGIAACLFGPAQRAVAAPDNTLGIAIMSALVDAGGNLVRGSGVTATERMGTGTGLYRLTFERDISACTYYATIGKDGFTFSNPAEIQFTTPIDPSAKRELWLQVLTTADSHTADLGFSALVFCPH